MAKAEKKETVLVECGHCEAQVAATVEGEFDVYADPIDCSVRYILMQCPKCSSPVLAEQNDEYSRDAHSSGVEYDERWGKTLRLYPEIAQRSLGQAVPQPIRNAFDEAVACYEKGVAYTASAIMCRKVLEGVCVTQGAKGNNLAAQLKDLHDKGELDKRLYEWITTLRMAGNEAAHDVSVTVSREDAGDLLDLAEAVAEYLYTVSEKFKEFQNRRAAKNKKTGP